eukprot:GEMP01111873.1.p1 GENE.GEMP01111873.1~~GEMP01111873.1.p1  ORF type:complete len:123 (+),score=5.72 GEMP01111873.1:245-613(+)
MVENNKNSILLDSIFFSKAHVFCCPKKIERCLLSWVSSRRFIAPSKDSRYVAFFCWMALSGDCCVTGRHKPFNEGGLLDDERVWQLQIVQNTTAGEVGHAQLGILRPSALVQELRASLPRPT